MNLKERNFWNDHRVRAAQTRARLPLTFTETDDEGEEIQHVLPHKWKVCPTCEGKGSHVNPAIDAGGLTSEDFRDDPDFSEEYKRGAYDVTCYGCGGRSTVPVLDWSQIPEELWTRIDRAAQEEAECEAICRAEREMGY